MAENNSNNSNSTVKDSKDLMGIAFRSLNNFKRNRALAHSSRQDGNRDKANYHELQQYKMIDDLELAMRAIQKGLRNLEEMNDDED